MDKKNQLPIFNNAPSFRVFFAVLLIILAVLGRTIFHLGENIEFVTAASLLAGSFLGLFWSITVPLVSMAISDLIIGNTLIFLFTWSAYLIIGILGFIFLRSSKGIVSQTIKATFTGVLASFVFFLWTNFGVWLLDSFGMYSDGLSGLIESYIFGLPFLKMNLLGNLFLVPLSFILFHLFLIFYPSIFKSASKTERSYIKKGSY